MKPKTLTGPFRSFAILVTRAMRANSDRGYRVATPIIRWSAVCIFCGAALAVTSVSAQEASSKSLIVVVKPIEPFVFVKNGEYSGFSVDLWKEIARRGELHYEMQQVSSVAQMLRALEDRQADVAVGALTISAEREKRIDLSHQFFRSGLQIAVMHGAGSPGTTMLKAVLVPALLGIVALLLVMMLVNAHLLWFFERRKNPELFPQPYLQGIWQALWWSTSTMITGGCENVAPVSVGGRLVAIGWMLGGILLVATLTATMTSALTVSGLEESSIKGPDDLPGRTVGTVGETAAAEYLVRHSIPPQEFADIHEALAALGNREVEAVVFDSPVLQYELAKPENRGQRLVGPIFDAQGYGLGFQQDSPLRDSINYWLLSLKEDGFIDSLRQKWFGTMAE